MSRVFVDMDVSLGKRVIVKLRFPGIADREDRE
jgi:hypothetical protein